MKGMLWQVIFSIRKQRNISMNIINSIKTMCIRVFDNYIPYFSKSCKRCNRLNRCGGRVYNWKSRKKKEQCWMIYFTFVTKKIIHSSFVLLWQIILTVPLLNLVPFALSITTENSRKYFLFSYREIVLNDLECELLYEWSQCASGRAWVCLEGCSARVISCYSRIALRRKKRLRALSRGFCRWQKRGCLSTQCLVCSTDVILTRRPGFFGRSLLHHSGGHVLCQRCWRVICDA